MGGGRFDHCIGLALGLSSTKYEHGVTDILNDELKVFCFVVYVSIHMRLWHEPDIEVL